MEMTDPLFAAKDLHQPGVLDKTLHYLAWFKTLQSADPSRRVVAITSCKIQTVYKIQTPKSKRPRFGLPQQERILRQSKIQTPNSKIRNPKSKRPRLGLPQKERKLRQSKIPNPKSKIQNPRSKIQNQKSEIQNPNSKLQNPNGPFGFWSLILGGPRRRPCNKRRCVAVPVKTKTERCQACVPNWVLWARAPKGRKELHAAACCCHASTKCLKPKKQTLSLKKQFWP